MKHSKSVAKQVFERLDSDPYTRQAMKLGIANYSAVAKRLGIKGSQAAVKAAVRRYAEQASFFDYSKGLKKILKETRISLASDLATLTLVPGLDVIYALGRVADEVKGEFSIVNSTNAVTLIFGEEHLKKVLKIVKERNVVKKREGVYALSLYSPPEIAETPGWVAFVSELLARNGVNIVEYYSCHTDTVFVLEKKDALKAYELLDKVLEK